MVKGLTTGQFNIWLKLDRNYVIKGGNEGNEKKREG